MVQPTPSRCRAACTLAAFAALSFAGRGLAQVGAVSYVETDKARYDPGSAVQFSLDVTGAVTGTQQLEVTYRHLGDVVGTQTVGVSSNNPTWSWSPPTDDFRGYLAEVTLVDGAATQGSAAIAVDVSSDWAKFPRYGFVSDYGFLSNSTMDGVADNLNRHHINGVQFYDWFNEHHQPLAGTPQSPSFNWKDIGNRDNFANTVTGYIDRAHDRNMVAMSYNLVYGINEGEGAFADGVQPSWRLYSDPGAQNPEVNPLPASFKDDITLVDPNNSGWRSYIAQQTADAFAVYGFDGWHMDQLGDRGVVYDQSGGVVDLDASFGPFVDAMAADPALAGKRFVINSVNRFGEQAINASPNVDFLYTEVWTGNEHYNDLTTIIRDNRDASGGLSTVLAAYMNYDLAGSPGTFNTAGVLLTDAVIFASGGAHIELGEHMLGREYFPNDNLQMPAELQERLVHYYDFLVGYQNLLRDGATDVDTPLRSPEAGISNGSAQQGAVLSLASEKGDREVFQLVNFLDATHMEWRDRNGTQPAPAVRTNVDLQFMTVRNVDRVWAASPDVDGGTPVELAFTQLPNGNVALELPSLEYWTMLVAEGEAPSGFDDSSQNGYGGGWSNGGGGGEGFGAWTLRAQSTPGGFAGFFLPDDAANAHDIDNAAALDPASGTAWASFANKGSGVEQATAFRGFNESLDGAGDSFGLTFEHGLVTGRVGVALRDGNAASSASDYDQGARFQFYFEGGDATYSLLDGAGAAFDTGIGFTQFGLSLDVQLTGLDTYDLTVWRYDEANDLTPQRFDFFGRAFAGSGSIDSLALFQFDAAGGIDQGDVFWNHLRYEAVASLLPGDANGDGVVDLLDFDVLAQNFGSATLGGAADGDFNGDGVVDLLDFDVLAQNFGASSPAVVPEPASLGVIGVAGLLAARRGLRADRLRPRRRHPSR